MAGAAHLIPASLPQARANQTRNNNSNNNNNNNNDDDDDDDDDDDNNNDDKEKKKEIEWTIHREIERIDSWIDKSFVSGNL